MGGGNIFYFAINVLNFTLKIMNEPMQQTKLDSQLCLFKLILSQLFKSSLSKIFKMCLNRLFLLTFKVKVFYHF